MKRTGVFATTEEITALKASIGQPLIALQTGMPESPQQMAHRYALAHDLPEITGYYGCDLRTGEFVNA